MDDLDESRTDPEAESQILRTLEDHGLHWDGPLQRQSARLDAYAAAIADLGEGGFLYYCTCSRRDLRHLSVYPGTCRSQIEPVRDAAIRVRVDDAAPRFTDLLRGEQITRLETAVGDFIVRRRDGIFAYQLATALDDSEPEIAHVVRGRDLLDNTPRQLHLMMLLERRPPLYAHLPLLVNAAGQKLSKQTGTRPVDPAKAPANIHMCLNLLGLEHPPDTDIQGLLDWAIRQWNLARVPADDHVVEFNSTG